VKNESKIIEKTLTNLCEKIKFDYWAICDTGSTDTTPEIIRDFFMKSGIPGELHIHEWRDFGHNRTLALECAYGKTDYVMVFDADDEIVGNINIPIPFDESSPHFDACMCQFGEKNSVQYERPCIVNNRKRWIYQGVLHEYIECVESATYYTRATGDYYIISGRTGNRSQNPNKYLDDAHILEKAFETAGDKQSRYAFYCAQSYRDCQRIDMAIEWYLKTLDLHGWIQEKYFSSFTLGNLYFIKKDYLNALKYWLKTAEYDTERIEGVVKAMEWARNDGQHCLVNSLYHRFRHYTKILSNKLFIDTNLYNDYLEYNNAISAYYVQDRVTGYECCKRIIINRICGFECIMRTILNLSFYKDFLEKDTEDMKNTLFQKIGDIIIEMKRRQISVTSEYYQIWNQIHPCSKPIQNISI
jgi:glycosyltransferase involved in cell wall biosynthesis